MQTAVRVEISTLVGMLQQPHWLRNVNASLTQTEFLAKLVGYSGLASADDADGALRQQRLRVMHVLRQMITPEQFTGEERKLRLQLLSQFFDEERLKDPSFHLQPTDTGHVQPEVQNLLDSAGASQLVVDLVTHADDPATIREAICLGIALLEGGNGQVQDTIFERLRFRDSAEFFRRIYVGWGIMWVRRKKRVKEK